MALSAVLFALMNFFAKLASSSASWANVGAARALVGAFVAIGVARARGASLAATDRKAVFWRSLFGTAAMMTTFYALSSRTLGLGDTVTLLNLMPVFLALLAPVFLRERTSKTVALGIMLALAGVVLVVRPSFLFGGHASALHGPGPSARATAAVAVLSAFFSSIAMMMLRHVGQKESAEAISMHFSLFAAATLAIVSLFDLRVPTARDAAFMIAAGVCAGFAQISMTHAYALEKAARVSAMSYLAVVTSALLGAIVLHEHAPAIAIGGMGLVVGGGVVVTLARAR